MSQNYQVEMFEHRDISAKLEEMYVQSMSGIGELTGYVKQLENVGDQRFVGIVHESKENAALQQRIAEIKEKSTSGFFGYAILAGNLCRRAVTGWSPFHKMIYKGAFMGLQALAVMERMFREQGLNDLYCIFYDPSKLQDFHGLSQRGDQLFRLRGSCTAR